MAFNPRSLGNIVTWKPGQSGNPGGRSKGFAFKLKQLCGEDYGKILDGIYLIAFGTPEEREAFFKEPVTVTTRERLAALIELRDSGPGRPAQVIISETPDVPLFAIGREIPSVQRIGGGQTEQAAASKPNGGGVDEIAVTEH